jgi:voltage-gated potassium channel
MLLVDANVRRPVDDAISSDREGESSTWASRSSLQAGGRSSALSRMVTRSLSIVMPTQWDKVVNRSDRMDRAWQFLEEPESSKAAYVFHKFMLIYALFAALVPIGQTLPDKLMSDDVFFWLSTAIDFVFLCEVVARWAVSPSTLGYLLSYYNILDMACIGPFIIRIYLYETLQDGDGGRFAESVLLVVVPVMRVIKALKSLSNFTLLVHTLQAVVEPLSIPLSLLILVYLSFSGALYVVEPRDNIGSIMQAMWLVAITVSTVGYGDLTPVTDAGRCIVGLMTLIGMLCTAMPISIVGAAFTEVWRNRTRIIIVGRMRDRLNQWQYTEEDLRILFRKFDEQDSGELDVEEFGKMVATMRLGLNEKAVERLYNLFDADGSGALDCDEFVEGIGLNADRSGSIIF